MGATIASIIKNLGEVPRGKFPPEYHSPRMARSFLFGTFGLPVGLILHLMLLIAFTFVGVKALAFFNIFSVFAWGGALYLLRKGYFWQSYFLIAIEIISHQALCVVLIGWDAGFQYYVLTNPSVVFLFHWSTPRKIAIAAVFACSYATMNYYASISTPYIDIDPLIIAAFNYSNIFSNIFLLCFTAFIYYRDAVTAEEKLEKEYQKTNEVLKERNKVLRRLNQELADAAEYVKTILPKPIQDGSIRTTWRFMPSTSLGGDAFGYHKVDDDHFAVYLLDVSGHGVGAALLSASVINVLRSQSLPNTDFKDPGQVLKALNLAFPSDANKDMFFTIWYGVFNKYSRELTYASAGHPPAILCDEDSSCQCHVNLLKTPNFVVGGIEGSTYVKAKCTVFEGNLLYIFSDGVYEVEKSDGSTWRFNEFVNFIRKVKTDGQAVLDRLYAHVRQIGKTENFEDDFTIVEVIFS